jgi:hypothetical protein
MPVTVIGTTLNNGFAGSYARHPEQIVSTAANASTAPIKFGTPLSYTATGDVVPFVAQANTTFAGIAGKEVKTSLNYLTQNEGGEYAVKEAVSVFERGSINVIVKSGVAVKPNDPVFITNTGEFTNVTASTSAAIIWAKWGTAADANGVAELVLTTRPNAALYQPAE